MATAIVKTTIGIVRDKLGRALDSIVTPIFDSERPESRVFGC
jgi:hypothetical protein